MIQMTSDQLTHESARQRALEAVRLLLGENDATLENDFESAIDSAKAQIQFNVDEKGAITDSELLRLVEAVWFWALETEQWDAHIEVLDTAVTQTWKKIILSMAKKG